MPELPEFAGWINPLLRALRELGGSARPKEVCEKIAKDHQVPEPVLEQTVANGVSRYENQVHWARYYLAEGGYIDRSRRGVWRLTELGTKTASLSDPLVRALLDEVQSRYLRSTTPRTVSAQVQRAAPTANATPLQLDEPAPDETREDYREELLSILRAIAPTGFERLCQRLLREADFENVVVTGRSGDGGIDGHGVLAVNPFVSFRVLFQCKRYAGAVGPSEVRDFRGAMQGRADKGIIITTGTFTTEARREALRDGVPPIELVDAERLVALFERLELGLTPRKTFEVDRSFFRDYEG